MTARFARGGSTQHMVEMLEEGLIEVILDGQTFDLDGVRSMRDDPRHQDTSPFTSYNFHGKGNFASMVDVAVLGATEVDLSFNGNVVTHSDGRLLHGIGGWQNCLAARCAMLLVPSFRDRIPVIVDEVTTLCGPGELIDVVVTERGIAVNPRRTGPPGRGGGLRSPDPAHRRPQGGARPFVRRSGKTRSFRPAGGGGEVGRRHRHRHRVANRLTSIRNSEFRHCMSHPPHRSNGPGAWAERRHS